MAELLKEDLASKNDLHAVKAELLDKLATKEELKEV